MELLLIPILVVVFFLFIGTIRHRRDMDNYDFFLMGRTAKSTDYVDTTVAYSLQVAVTVYFIYWGYTYGLANLGFVITWGVGFYLFSLAIPKLSDFVDHGDTFA